MAMRHFLSILFLLGITGAAWCQPTLREIRPVPGQWTITPQRCLEASYGADSAVRIYLWMEGLEVWQNRKQMAWHPAPPGIHYPTQSLVATWIDPKHQTIPMLVLGDNNETTVLAFPQGWKGAVFQQTFSHAASEATFLKTDVDPRGFHRFTKTTRNARGNRDTVYLWNGTGFTEQR